MVTNPAREQASPFISIGVDRAEPNRPLIQPSLMVKPSGDLAETFVPEHQTPKHQTPNTRPQTLNPAT